MRTTLDIADDVLFAVKERARREKRSAGEVLSELARQGLMCGPAAGVVADEGSFFGFEPLPRRGPALSNEIVDRLREDEPG
jgi:hypothetical protein